MASLVKSKNVAYRTEVKNTAVVLQRLQREVREAEARQTGKYEATAKQEVVLRSAAQQTNTHKVLNTVLA